MKDAVEKINSILNHPEQWDFSGAKDLYVGVDVGTYKIFVIVVDEKGQPRAANMRRAEVVKSGMIVDYVGAVDVVRELMEEIRERCPVPLEKGATSYPPQTESGNINTTRYILESVDLEVLNVLDEPTAANLVLRMRDGAIVDVGGGTTGVAVIEGGNVVYSNDEPTGGVHLSLVLAGALKVSYEEAEEIKISRESKEILPIIRPVIDKVSSITGAFLEPYRDIERICLVGGSCELDGFTEIVGRNLGLTAFRPVAPQVITPFGIALSCLQGNGNGSEGT